MRDSTECMVCGQPLDQHGHCANCGSAEEVSLQRNKITLPVLALIIIAAFSFTRMVVQWFEQRQQQIASDWYSQGVTALRASHADAAVEYFETALAYAKQDNDEYRFRLAQALVAAGRMDEAQARLLNLWNDRPSNAMVNLALARLSARRGDLANAVRYYHGALDGVWGPEKNPTVERAKARFEVADLLLSHRQPQEAESELVALAQELPPDAAARVQLGQMLLQIGDVQRAFAEFQQARQLDHQNEAAIAGLGAAELQRGDLLWAQRYLAEALRMNSRDENAKQLLDKTERLLKIDPFSPGLGAGERARRTLAAYQTANQRLQSCLQSRAHGTADRRGSSGKSSADALAGLQRWAAELQPYAREQKLRGRDDVVENMMRFVFATEDQAAQLCGAPAGDDELLATIGRHRWRNE